MSQPSDDSPRLRASDDDRSRVVASLQEALRRGQLTLGEFDERARLAYNSRFRDELEVLLADLDPAPTPPARPTPRPVPAPRDQITGDGGGTNLSVGLLGSTSYEGVWQIGDGHTSISIMGSTELNLSEARLPGQETVINAVAVMGSVAIYVPEDFRIISDGAGVMGSFSVEDDKGVTLRQADVAADAPVIRVRGVGFMGSVEIYRVPRD